MRLVLGSQNNGSAAMNVASKTVTLSNLPGFDIDIQGINSIYNVTRSAFLYPSPNQMIVSTASVITESTGAETNVFTFNAMPAGWSNGDTIIVVINTSLAYASFLSLLYQKP
jgi:hypothetical protein